MRMIIEYKNVEKKLVRNNLQVISMNAQDREDERIYILKHGESEGNYFTLKNALSVDIVED